tara:strand:- start:972 stop:1511 length:540 start_codon:yes stop_codon:yes gene_type:complete
MKKRCCINRRGYFFLIDSVLALGVLAIGAFLIFTFYADVPEVEPPEILSEDIMDFFATSKIKDINNEYAGLGGELWDSGVITNAENTLLQQIAEFYADDNLDIAEKFIVNLTVNSFPQQYIFEFRLNKELIYPKDPTEEHLDSKSSTRILIPSKKIVYGINQETGDMFGPYNAEVLVWQ